jgi:hypothetical protein
MNTVLPLISGLMLMFTGFPFSTKAASGTAGTESAGLQGTPARGGER